MSIEPCSLADAQATIPILFDDPPPPLPAPVLTCQTQDGALLTFPALLSPGECARIIAACSPLETPHSYNRTRAIVLCPSLASLLLTRLQLALDAGAGGGGAAAAALHCALRAYSRHGSTWVAAGVNPVMRFVAYQEGGRLGPHLDATTRCSVDRCGMFTVMAYLTEGYEGGQLRVLRAEKDGGALDYSPGVGDVVLLDRRLLHEGLPVVAGPSGALKCMVRSELVCARTPPISSAADAAASALLEQALAAQDPAECGRLTDAALAMSSRLEEVYLNV